MWNVCQSRYEIQLKVIVDRKLFYHKQMNSSAYRTSKVQLHSLVSDTFLCYVPHSHTEFRSRTQSTRPPSPWKWVWFVRLNWIVLLRWTHSQALPKFPYYKQLKAGWALSLVRVKIRVVILVYSLLGIRKVLCNGMCGSSVASFPGSLAGRAWERG